MSERNIVPLDCTELIKREGWDCAACGHRHSGRTLANICIGCPCPETKPKPAAQGERLHEPDCLLSQQRVSYTSALEATPDFKERMREHLRDIARLPRHCTCGASAFPPVVPAHEGLRAEIERAMSGPWLGQIGLGELFERAKAYEDLLRRCLAALSAEPPQTERVNKALWIVQVLLGARESAAARVPGQRKPLQREIEALKIAESILAGLGEQR